MTATTCLVGIAMMASSAAADDTCVTFADDAALFDHYDAGYDTIDDHDDWFFDYYEFDQALDFDEERAGEKLRRLQGRIVGLKPVQVRGLSQTHVVAIVRTRSGAQLPVDLGPRRAVQILDVGDHLTVDGNRARIRGRLVLIAKYAYAGDRTIAIDRAVMRDQVERSGRIDVPCAPALS
jgi:hypothetical protein